MTKGCLVLAPGSEALGTWIRILSCLQFPKNLFWCVSYPYRWFLAFFIQCEILPTRPFPAHRRHHQVFESWLWHQRAPWESRTSPGEWSQEEPAHIWAPYSHLLPAGKQKAAKWVWIWDARGCQVLSLHSRVLRDRMLFPSPWPLWESTQNWDAVSHPPPPKWMGLGHKWRSSTEYPALKPKLQISFYAYALHVSNLILHSCLTARERLRKREGIAWIHLRVYLFSCVRKKGKRILRERSNAQIFQFGGWAWSVKGDSLYRTTPRNLVCSYSCPKTPKTVVYNRNSLDAFWQFKTRVLVGASDEGLFQSWRLPAYYCVLPQRVALWPFSNH